jgi:histidinol-phosphate aminotransferase
VEDPAYASAVPLAKADPHVLVTRTFSKIFGMAGLRVGYAVAHPETLAPLRTGSNGIMSNASMTAAVAALGDAGYVATERARNTAVRRFTRERFESAGYRVLPSSANFLMIDVRQSAGAFGGRCRQQGIYVARPFPPLDSYVRLTVGTMAEMEEAVPAMLALLAAPASARLGDAEAAWAPERAC